MSTIVQLKRYKSPAVRFVAKTKPAVSFKTTKSSIFTSMQSYDSLIRINPELVEPADGCESPPYRHHVPARCGKVKFVPELANLPLKYIHCPWEASTSTLKEAGVKIGVNYPARIVDLAATRDEALTAYKMIK